MECFGCGDGSFMDVCYLVAAHDITTERAADYCDIFIASDDRAASGIATDGRTTFAASSYVRRTVHVGVALVRFMHERILQRNRPLMFPVTGNNGAAEDIAANRHAAVA